MPGKLVHILGAAFAALILGALSSGAAAQERPLMRISTENASQHVHSRIVADFAQALRRRLGNRLDIVHTDSARLFRDREVIHALQQGQVEMAVPGTWQLDRFEPSVGVFLLPAFYGLDAETNYHLRDGAPGQEISHALRGRLDVMVPGRWIDLGFAHIYTRKPVTSHKDLAGLVVRSPGGEANAARLRALGMIPVVIPWPELPEFLNAGKVDAVMTTHETFASAALWRHGLRYAFEDRQYFAQYIPIVSGKFWNRLPADIQAAIAEVWEAQVDDARTEAVKAQKLARIKLIENGVSIITPDEEALRQWRARIAGEGQDALIVGLGIDPLFAAEVIRQIGDVP